MRVKVHDEDYDGSMAMEIHSLNVFFVSKIDKIHVYDLTNLEYKSEIDIELMKQDAKDREPNEILGMTLSKC